MSGEGWEVEACEVRETELADGDSTLFGFGDGESGFVALPRIRPPPSVLRDMVMAA